ncbi:MAG: ABC transporter substrate-binding protein [Acidimicrobiales bacterium]
MSSTFDRRSFLTHSAATIGGVALAGTIVDDLLATSASAAAAIGVNKGTPKRGGTLTVGTLSDVPNYHIFNGAQGKLDASGFCVANALYDPLFVMSANGKVALPMLALSATPNATYTTWTIALRQGVNFTNGDAFNADIVVANWVAANADVTVGLAIKPIIESVTKIDEATVSYNLIIPYSTFPVFLAEQQIGYMAHPSSFVSSYTGNPIGTGPFKVKSWQVGVESQFTRNGSYWKSDSHGRQLPYLSAIHFKTIVDPEARNEALQAGNVDMILQQTGPQILALEHIKGVSVITDINAPRDPGLNFLIMNTTGTLNQYFAWAGQFAQIGVPGSLQYLEKGTAAPQAVQEADWLGTLGAVNPSSGQWDTTMKPVVNDPTVRKALAMAINRSTFHRVIDNNVGALADGVFRKTSPYYKNPGYPAYNVAKAKALINAYKSKNNVSEVAFVMDIVSGSSSELKTFDFFQQEFAKIGVTITSRQSVQSQLINNVIYGEFDCATWNQFGGCDESQNYVWWNSQSATAGLAAGGLGMSLLPAGTQIAGAVNFAHQADPVIETALLTALASRPGSAAKTAAWQTVNRRFAIDLPYLMLDTTVNAWAARSDVQNWAFATAGDGTTRSLNPDAGASRWDQVWKS